MNYEVDVHNDIPCVYRYKIMVKPAAADPMNRSAAGYFVKWRTAACRM